MGNKYLQEDYTEATVRKAADVLSKEIGSGWSGYSFRDYQYGWLVPAAFYRGPHHQIDVQPRAVGFQADMITFINGGIFSVEKASGITAQEAIANVRKEAVAHLQERKALYENLIQEVQIEKDGGNG